MVQDIRDNYFSGNGKRKSCSRKSEISNIIRCGIYQAVQGTRVGCHRRVSENVWEGKKRRHHDLVIFI